MPIAVTAAVQATTPPRVVVTVTGLTAGTPFTLSRVVDEVAAPLRGYAPATPAGTVAVAADSELPFDRLATYRVEQAAASAESAPPVYIAADAPWLSDPITGRAARVTVVDWPELTRPSRSSIIAVAGRAAPVVVSRVRGTPSGDRITLRTGTADELAAVRAVLATGAPLLLRVPAAAVEGAWIAVGDVVERRVGDTGDDWRRWIALEDVTIVDPVDETIPAAGDTLDDLTAAVPGTLADIAAQWSAGTLADIAATYLAGL